MAHKTFISYKYSDALHLRDKIIRALGDDAAYYKGENGYTEDLSGYKAETIKEHLKGMIYDTSVMIVVISPEMIYSKWIPWEIEYALKDIKRGDRYSRSNGLVGVIKAVDGGYSWLKHSTARNDGCLTYRFDESKLPAIVRRNLGNQKPKVYACEQCKSIDWLNGSYISLIEEEQFLEHPKRYINNAFDKSQNLSGYDLVKTIAQ